MSAIGQLFDFAAADGTPLAGVRFGDGASRVLEAGALGVPQRFYAGVCGWLAARAAATGAGRPADLGPARLRGRGAPAGRRRGSLLSARFPITAFAFSDDEAMTPANVHTLLAALPHARSVLPLVQPVDVGLPSIGHLGAFRRSAAALWPRRAEAIDNAAPCPPQPNSACCPSSRR